MPYNLKQLLNYPDFLIEDKLGNTGPYYLKSSSPTKVELSRNTYYPEHLVANNIEEVVFKSYPASNFKRLTSEPKG